MFTIFLIIAAWNLPLPQWLQVCLTIFGICRIIFSTTADVIEIRNR